jgi:hypothetical protein
VQAGSVAPEDTTAAAAAVPVSPEGLNLHRELADGVCQRCVQLVIRPAVKQSLQPLLPAVKRLSVT